MPKRRGNKKAMQNRTKVNGRLVKEKIPDAELQGFTKESAVQPTSGSFLSWNKKVNKIIKGPYSGNSRWTARRNRIEIEENKKGNHSITEWIKPAIVNLEQQSEINEAETGAVTEKGKTLWESKLKELDRISEVLPDLKMLIQPVMNTSSEGSLVSSYEERKLLAVYYYFLERINGANRGVASESAADFCWPIRSQYYRSKIIVTWAKEFLSDRKLSHHNQGVHIKRQSFLSDNDVKNKILQMLRTTKPEKRSLYGIKEFIDKKIVPSLIGVDGSDPSLENYGLTISLSTIQNYMYEWGYSYRRNNKDVYYDGHDRDDVIEYRHMWAPRMMEYYIKMQTYDYDGRPEKIELEDEPKYILVTQDESTFYAHDGKKDMWLVEDETPLRNKSPGKSIMVSEFQCACHGTMKAGSLSSRKTFKAGAAREGYWTSDDMVKQLKDEVIPVFESLHPNDIAVFIFDQSSNHNAFGKDSLVASRMTLNPKPVTDATKYIFRDTKVVLNDGSILQQSFYEMMDVDVVNGKSGKVKTKKMKCFKGIKQILKERKQWYHDLEGNEWNAYCQSPTPGKKDMCCARHFLQSRPDFKAQNSALEEVVVNAGHIFELYPKFHCECNWIERYWGAAKRLARLNCDYSYKGLEDNLDEFLDKAGDITSIRRYYMRCMRYIDAYSKQKNGKEAEATIKQFTQARYASHRRIRVDA